MLVTLVILKKNWQKGLMFLVTEKLKVAVSTHIPVSEISKKYF